MTDTRYLIVGGGLTATPLPGGSARSTPTGDISLVPRRAIRRTPGRRSRRGSGRAMPSDTVWRAPPSLGVDERVGRGSSRSTSTAHRRPTTAATSTRTRSCCSRPAAARAGFPSEGDEVVYFRTLDDYHGSEDRRSGAGVVGSAAGSSARRSRRRSRERLQGDDGVPGARDRLADLPGLLSAFGQGVLREQGDRGGSRRSVTRVERGRGVAFGRRGTLEADAVVAGLGIEPNVELARTQAFRSTNGIVVDTGVASAGRGRVRRGRRRPFPGAPDSGRRASSTRTTRRATAGGWARTWPAPPSRTITCRSSTPTCSTSATKRSASSTPGTDDRRHGRARIEGRRLLPRPDRRPRGALLWNRFGEVDAARELIAAGEPIARDALAGRVR